MPTLQVEFSNADSQALKLTAYDVLGGEALFTGEKLDSGEVSAQCDVEAGPDGNGLIHWVVRSYANPNDTNNADVVITRALQRVPVNL